MKRWPVGPNLGQVVVGPRWRLWRLNRRRDHSHVDRREMRWRGTHGMQGQRVLTGFTGLQTNRVVGRVMDGRRVHVSGRAVMMLGVIMASVHVHVQRGPFEGGPYKHCGERNGEETAHRPSVGTWVRAVNGPGATASSLGQDRGATRARKGQRNRTDTQSVSVSRHICSAILATVRAATLRLLPGRVLAKSIPASC
jgi:hypothetical protein